MGLVLLAAIRRELRLYRACSASLLPRLIVAAIGLPLACGWPASAQLSARVSAQGSGHRAGAAPQDAHKDQQPRFLGVPASPAAVDQAPGTGDLGRWLGLPAGSPWRLGGVWVGNSTEQLAGGSPQIGGLGLAQQLLIDLSLDLDHSLGWKGAKLWLQGLQVNANQSAGNASGSLQGSNSLVTPPPLNRTELYSYAFSQFLFDQQVRLLVGKLAPSNDFANTVVPVAESFGSPYWIPSLSSLTYTPLYAMPTLQGRLPGYPNSALGSSLLIRPKAFRRDLYLKLGVFDGRAGSGVEPSIATGLAAPSLSGPLFSIVELGGSWSLGLRRQPGAASFGLWQQGGPLRAAADADVAREAAARGGYLIVQQRLIDFRFPIDPSGVSTFLQVGWSPARSNLFTSSIGGGLTMFAPMRSRRHDSYGVGLSWAQINPQGPLAAFANRHELMLQAYGQISLLHNLFLTPSFTLLPIVGHRDAAAPSSSALLQLVALF